MARTGYCIGGSRVAAIDSPGGQQFPIFVEKLIRGARRHLNCQPKDLIAVELTHLL
jgi:hypothetical protein